MKLAILVTFDVPMPDENTDLPEVADRLGEATVQILGVMDPPGLPFFDGSVRIVDPGEPTARLIEWLDESSDRDERIAKGDSTWLLP